MRNRGYKFIINENETGYWILCINATWINHLLRDRGIEPRNFRALNWRDIAAAAPSEKLRKLGLRVESLAVIASLEDGKIEFDKSL